MKATCPNSEEHRRFITVAHVSQDWVVDERGNFIEEADPIAGDIVSKPNPDNTWSCIECGADAKVTR